MKQVPLGKVFNTTYGNSFSLQRMREGDTAFIARGSSNNGVSAYVSLVDHTSPFKGKKITVALSGSVLEAFYHTYPFYTGYHIKVLTAINELTEKEYLLYCSFIRANKYRYNFGRQANKTLENILIPHLDEVKKIAGKISIPNTPSRLAFLEKAFALNVDHWKIFKYKELFYIERGRGARKNNSLNSGATAFISASESNNGLTGWTNHEAMHKSGVISVVRNGNSVASAFYQEKDFCSTEDVHIFKPKFQINSFIALFLCTLIKKEKYRFNYGRKWGIARMRESEIKLPITKSSEPDWEFMENYIKSLPYSSNLVTSDKIG